MSKKRGLGKGLEALIPVYKGHNNNTLRNIPLTSIKPNPNQPRKNINEDKLAELAASIKEHGVIQPIVVRQLEDQEYQLVAGERRWRACKTLSLETIPAVVAEYTDHVSTEVALIENLQREDLNPLEEATAYQSLINEFGLTQEEVAQRVGKSRSLVANMLRLLALPRDVLKLLSQGEISTGHARALLPLNDHYLQIKMVREIIKRQLSVRQTEDLVNKLLNKTKPETTTKNLDPQLISLTDQLESVFGTKVQIKTNKQGKGKLEIEFYNQDDLARIMDIVLPNK